MPDAADKTGPRNAPVALHWFRSDLRLADNPALLAASRCASQIIPVFIWSPEEEGGWPPGSAARWWLHESLQQLQQELIARGSRLLLRRGPTAPALLELSRQTGATLVYWNNRHEPAARKVEAELGTALRTAGITGLGFASRLLAEPGTVRSSTGSPYQVFTPFWRAFLEQVQVDPPQPSPRALPAPRRWPASLALQELALLPDIPWHKSLAQHWQPGEVAARAVLRKFVTQGLDAYEAARDRPDLDGTSRMSPYLHHGELSPRQLWTAVGRASERAGQSPQQWQRGRFCAEIIWREFAAQQLFHHPTLPDRSRLAKFDSIAWRNDARDFAAWTRGRTGFPIVDAGMRQLWQCGWMHNRVRMITASFLVKNLLHRWQDGERWFWDTLVDADLASNALNWQWVAGTSPDAAPWFRIFNPLSQAQRFDPQGTYQQRFVPEAGTAVYTAPIIDLGKSRQRALDAYKALREAK
jgi:deoxyribodipyrimidine photo-lyase